MKAVFVMLVMSTLAACTAVEQDHDDNAPNLGSAASELLQPHGGGVGAFCGGFTDPPCNPGLFCSLGVCTPPGGVGAACGGFVDPPCAANLFCVFGFCTPPGGQGAFCGGIADPPCAAGLFCSGGICR
jgi:hypothetical protein